MPKRKNPKTCEEELEHIMKKMRKLERKIRDKGSPASDSPPLTNDNGLENPATPMLELSDWLSEELDNAELVDFTHEVQAPADDGLVDAMTPQEAPCTSSGAPALDTTNKDGELDTDVLEILGDDPLVTEKLGKDIRQELACRLDHTSTEGLNKEARKELISKYPIPANCLRINAPKINPEIKVAIPENTLKRDKGIEAKQKQMASAISCLGEIITAPLTSKDMDKETLQKLMDLSRLLCDIQHGDSVTRRNFILFSLKKDLKEHLSNTKIDNFLFSVTLAETIKTAKSINKSGVELKADAYQKNILKRPKTLNQKNLNRKAPGPGYRQPGQPPRSYEPVAPRAPPPPLPPAHSSRQPLRQQQLRAPMQIQGRRRY